MKLISVGKYLFIFFMALLLSGCESVLREAVKAPEVNLTAFRMAEVGLINQTFVLTLNIKNPNKVPLPIKGFSYQIFVAGDEFANGNSQSEFSLPAGGEKNVDVSVTMNLLRSGTHLAHVIQGGSTTIDYELRGLINVNLPLLGGIPINKKGQIDLMR
ncbi:MAG TPA: LEA type 2 family protein [Pseudomonadales bacterium]|nr:LEA type 2 family protein [Pseudomonadales bacterium]